MKPKNKEEYTPMMQQYLTVKEEHPDKLVLFRLGDFYELFFEDAITAARVLEIALTGRDAGQEDRVPMCGVPHHAVESYLEKLVQNAFKVAIVEQVEDASVAKGIVKREVVRICTPGTFIDGTVDQFQNNFITAIFERDGFEICYADLSTGQMSGMFLPHDVMELQNTILRIQSKELLVNSVFDLSSIKPLVEANQITVSIFDDVDGAGDSEVGTAYQMLLNYFKQTQKRELKHLQPLKLLEHHAFLMMDPFTLKNLELIETLRAQNRRGSLFWYMDETETAMGSRYLRAQIEQPLRNATDINKRLDVVEELKREFFSKDELKEYLKTVYDLERIIGRISYGSATGKDLVQLRTSLSHIPDVKQVLSTFQTESARTLGLEMDAHESLYDLLERAVVDQPPLTIKEGGVIKAGFSRELDEIKSAAIHGKDWLKDLEVKERERTGISKLKIGYNKVFGYYLEVTKGQLSLVTEDFGYERKQTLANAERYSSPELKEMEKKILSSEEMSMKLEYQLFLGLRTSCMEHIMSLQILAKQIAEIDYLISLATIADKYRLVRPSFGEKMEILDGRHPVLESILKDQYVENDVHLDQDRSILLITGPNMSGKSTYMRLVATIVVMAQMGSFVPASKAVIQPIDKIFTRIGAADDLIRGQSTFMVEMLEVNQALRHATKDSLILFDEIGRGTATFDGLALAQAILEYIHEHVKAKTLFSTHYHELTQLEHHLGCLRNVHVAAKEEKDGLVFYHKVKEGAVDKSYGINVAKLAQLPNLTIKRAKQILAELESNAKQHDVSLFNMVEEEPEPDLFKERIKALNINELTPLEAMQLLASIIEEAKE